MRNIDLKERQISGKPFSRDNRLIYTSLARIADFQQQTLRFVKIDRDHWQEGDYMLAEVVHHGAHQIELTTGRMAPVMRGDLLVGAIGTRYATLEATGSWKQVTDINDMDVLTGAGLFGKVTSQSLFLPPLIKVRYVAHIVVDEKVRTMAHYIPDVDIVPFTKPVILFVGTSMSSGKTTSARIVTRILKDEGYSVVAAKLTGAGRYRDILAMRDAGANHIFDFMDVGLPSSVVSPEIFEERAKILLSLMQNTKDDVAVIEAGASPLEPYNGDIAIDLLGATIKCVVLCASDPYSVYGVMNAFDIRPDIVSGPATNTLGGVDLIKSLCGLDAVNLIEERNIPRATAIILERLGQ